MPDVTVVDDGVRCLDLEFQGRPGVIAAYLLEDDGERALIEIGPTTTLETLLGALRVADVAPETISRVLVTHVHLDHAGAAGNFLARFPQAQLYVHEIGAPHLIDPSRLIRSATRIYGDLMDILWGEITPVPEEKVTVLGDGDTVSVGNRPLVVLYTPGHASHHVVFHDVARDAVFAGDVAGARLQGFGYVRPPTPPPDLDLALWDQSLQRVRDLHPRALYLTHFGPFSDAVPHLQQLHDNLYRWADIVQHAVDRGQAPPEITDNLRFHADRDLLALTNDAMALERYELATPYGMSVDGYLRYFTKRKQAVEEGKPA